MPAHQTATLGPNISTRELTSWHRSPRRKATLDPIEMKSSKKLTFIDLFAGCGGLSEGFLQANTYEALAHVEWEIPMVETLRARLVQKWKHSEDDARRRVIHFDIQKTKELINGDWKAATKKSYDKTNDETVITNGLRGLVGKRKVNLIIGGPPCQAYSIAGRAQDKDSMKFDYRNYLFESFVKVVEEFQPDAFIFENVPGLLSACPGSTPVTDRIYKAFQGIGYEIRSPELLKKSIYTASDFGVPQSRNRVIIVGVKEDSNRDLERLYQEIDSLRSKSNPRTVKSAIFGLPKFKTLPVVKRNGKNISHSLIGNSEVTHHEARFHNPRDIRIFRQWIKGKMNSATIATKLAFYKKMVGKSSNHAKYRSLLWNQPSPKIVAHLHKDGLMFIHPDAKQARSITVREAAALQSFPDDYNFKGNQGQCFKMIGNAVPPEMAKHIANAIYKGLLNNGN